MSAEGFDVRQPQRKLEQPRRVRHGIKFRRKLGLEGLPWHAGGFVAACEDGIRPDANVHTCSPWRTTLKPASITSRPG